MKILLLIFYIFAMSLQINAGEVHSAKSALRFVGEGCWALQSPYHRSRCFRTALHRLEKRASVAEWLTGDFALCDSFHMYSYRNSCMKAAIKYSNVRSWQKKFIPIESRCDSYSVKEEIYRCYRTQIGTQFKNDYINSGTNLQGFLSQIVDAALTLPNVLEKCTDWGDGSLTCDSFSSMGGFFKESIQLYLNDSLPLTAKNIVSLCLYNPIDIDRPYNRPELKNDCAYLAANNSGRPEFQDLIEKCKEIVFNGGDVTFPALNKPLTTCVAKEIKKMATP